MNKWNFARPRILRPVEERFFCFPLTRLTRKLIETLAACAEADRCTRGLSPDDIAHFSPDKPRKCKHCYWYDPLFGCCSGKHCAYYIPLEVKESPCFGCAYAKDHPCIGFCMKEVLTKDHKRVPYVVKWIE